MKETNVSEIERRRYPRLKAPVFFRSPSIFGLRNQIYNISLGGARVYSDNHFRKGKHLEIRIFLSNEHSIEATARVVWIKELPPGFDAIYDVGLEFVSLPPYAMYELKSVLERRKRG